MRKRSKERVKQSPDKKKVCISTTMATAETAASPDLSSSSGDEWTLLGEGNANVVFSYGGRDPELVRDTGREERERS